MSSRTLPQQIMSKRSGFRQTFNPMDLDEILNGPATQQGIFAESSRSPSSRPTQTQMTRSTPQAVDSGSRLSMSSPVQTPITSPPVMQPSPYATYAYSPPPTEQARRPVARQLSTARDPRPKWPEEHAYFVWYCRTDLGQPWDQVLERFEEQFRQKRAKGGLQCKFYRLLEIWNVPKVREQNKAEKLQNGRTRAGVVGKFGLVQRTHLRYRWMKAEHQSMPPLAQFASETASPPSLSASPCGGCAYCMNDQES